MGGAAVAFCWVLAVLAPPETQSSGPSNFKKNRPADSESSQVKVYHMQRQWARLARRGWCAGVVPTAPRSLERIRREMRQAEPPARGGAAQASLGL